METWQAILLGVILGYIFHTMIQSLVGKARGVVGA